MYNFFLITTYSVEDAGKCHLMRLNLDIVRCNTYMFHVLQILEFLRCSHALYNLICMLIRVLQIHRNKFIK